jgi:DNA ligase-1
MENVIKIIEDLRKTSSTNDKITIIKKNADNKVFTDILKYTYDDNLQFGFSENKLRNLLHEFRYKNQNTWASGFDMLNTLAKSNINDSLRNNVLTFLSIKSYDEQELWINVLTKDLRCNISNKTINKAIKGLIPEFNIQQAYQISKYPLKKDTWFCLEEKLNGINCSDLNGIMLSRQGKELSNLGHILQQLEQLSFKGYYFNGELVRKNTNNISNGENFRLTTSIVNSDAEDKTMIDFIVFDLLPIEEFYKGKSKLKYKERLKLLKQLKQESIDKGLINLDIPYIYYEGNDISVVDEYLELATSQDKEGLMAIKDCEWKNKRHNGILKIKKFSEIDLIITNVLEGEGRLEGTMGALKVDYKDNELNVGSGYDDEFRKWAWANKDNLIGRNISVKYKEETQDKKTKKYSLQFPIFLKLNPEWKEPNIN